MHLESLRVFCDVVRLRSFSRGAAANFVSQSAASQSIQHLERALGVTLLDRSQRPVGVTREGLAVYAGAQALLEGWERLRAAVGSSRARIDGTVRVAAIYSVGLHDMSHHLERFMARYPDARVQLECLHPQKVVEAVLGNEADVGIMSYPPAGRGLAVLPLRDEPMAFVCHPAHRLARRRLVLPADLAEEPFVAFDRELAIRRAIDRALRHEGVRLKVVLEFDNIETIKQAIMNGAGVSLLPAHTVEKEAGIRTLAATAFGLPGLVRRVGIIHRRQKALSATVTRFIELLREPSVGSSTTSRAREAAEPGADPGRTAAAREAPARG